MDETERSFEGIYRRWYRRMALFAATFAPIEGGEAECLAHDVLVHAWYRMDRFDPTKPFSPWLYRVARNFIVDYLRRRPDTVRLNVGTVRAPGDAGPGGDFGGFAEPAARGDDPAELAVNRDLAARVDRAVASLDGKDRRVALLVMRDGLTAREAGLALGMPAGTVRWRVSRIRAAVRRAVDRETDTGAARGREARDRRDEGGTR